MSNTARSHPPIQRAALLVAALAIALLGGCSEKDDPTGPDWGPLEGITETDGEGTITSVDPDDWCMSGVILNSRLYVDSDDLWFRVPAVGDTGTAAVRALNYSSETVVIDSVSADTLFAVTPPSALLGHGDDVTFTVEYVQTDSLVYEGEITFHATPDTAAFFITVRGEIDDGGEVTVDPEFSFGPAAPNPCVTSTAIPYNLPAECHVLITISDGEDVVRTLLDLARPAGPHVALWDCTDGSGHRVPAGIYRAHIEAGGLTCWGDIQVLAGN